MNKIKRGEKELNFEVIYEIIEEEKKISKFDKIEYDNDFCFIELLKNKLHSFIESGRIVPNVKIY